MTDTSRPTIAVIGGTGALGLGLATRWARAGYPVIVGSRDAVRAMSAAKDLPGSTGLANPVAAGSADILVLAVPFAGREPILESIREGAKGKIVVDTTVPLMPPRVGSVTLPEGGSAAQMTQTALGEGARVVAAFHNVAAAKLLEAADIDCDVLVCGDKLADRRAVIDLAAAAGLRGIHAGPLANAVAPESLTPVLISINRRYKLPGAGIRITGDLKEPE